MKNSVAFLFFLLLSQGAFAITPEAILTALDKNREYGTISYTATMEIHVGDEMRDQDHDGAWRGRGKSPG